LPAATLEDRLGPRSPPHPQDREHWRGVGCLLALPDVSFLCLPDLPTVFAVPAMAAPSREPTPETAEEFVECATETPVPDDEGSPPPSRTARCDEAGFGRWATCVLRLKTLIAQHLREVQFIAALPLPITDADLPADLPGRAGLLRRAAEEQWNQAAILQSAFVQLTYPWIISRSSARLPEGVESPDGVLAGVLAGNALTRGTHRSALGRSLRGVSRTEPVLARGDLLRRLATRDPARTVREHVSVFGPVPDGIRLLSDVTTAADAVYRPANLNRLVSALVRSCRVAGESVAFENSGETAWADLTDALTAVLTGFWEEGAFVGGSPDEAFRVRCDRSTMTQNDLDAGRLIVEVTFHAAAPIETVKVILALTEGGQVSLIRSEPEDTPQP
jgi:hypothetical protein